MAKIIGSVSGNGVLRMTSPSRAIKHPANARVRVPLRKDTVARGDDGDDDSPEDDLQEDNSRSQTHGAEGILDNNS